MNRRSLLGGLAGLAASRPAWSAVNPALLDISQYVYVPSAVTPDVSVIEIGTNRIVGQLHSGVVPLQAVVSRSAATLVAIDGKSAAACLVDVFAGTTRRVALPSPAQRLTVAANGQLAAATDLPGGSITVIDLGDGRVSHRITGLPRLRDAMFGERDTVLYIAAEGISGIGVVDLASGTMTRQIAAFKPGSAGVAALARTPDGRRLLALPQAGGPIGVIDAASGAVVGQLPAGVGTEGVYPSGIGNFLLIPDSLAATLGVFRTAHPADPVSLPGAAGIVGIYTTWLDSVAFMPSAARRSVLVYDLDSMQRTDDIALCGKPAQGAVTSDSRALYLPVLDPPSLLVLDGESRSITATLEIPHQPLAALIAGGSGLCH
jgi:DNA-binding beta-propeller fold protein YncE